jgi:hypothetical protein
MRVRRLSHGAQQGQALILALVLLGLLSAFSVAVMRLASASQDTASSVREAAYRDAQGEAGALMARQLVADGLGCTTNKQVTAQVAGTTITVKVTTAPSACSGQDNGNGNGDGNGNGNQGTVAGTYIITGCATGSAPTTITVVARQPNEDTNTLNVDVVHFAYGSNSSC